MFPQSYKLKQLYTGFTLSVIALAALFPQASVAAAPVSAEPKTPYERALAYLATIAIVPTPTAVEVNQPERMSAATVPFYSQFTDITKPGWQKVGCGIAGIAMLIDYYSDAPLSVDALLETGINRNAFLPDAGWTHAGLIGLAKDYGLDGESRSLSSLSLDAALAELARVTTEGPVLVSVHYTFEPTNPIPHLVVISAVKDGRVYYNDPAEASGNGSLSVEKFAQAWKKRYIVVRPV